MKKMSLVIAFAMIVSLFSTTALAATGVFYDFSNMENTEITNGLPDGWGNLAGTRTSEFVSGGMGLPLSEKYWKVTNTTSSGGWSAPPVAPGIHQFKENENIAENQKLHLTATISASDTNFYHLGLYARRANIEYTKTDDTTGSFTDKDFSGEIGLLIFEKDSAVTGGYKLTSWGQDVTPDNFVFELNRFYRLDCVINGITNTMDTYLNGVFLGTVDYTSAFSAILETSEYKSFYISQLKRIGIVQHKIKNYSVTTTAGIYNTGCTLYGADETMPAISATESDVEIDKFKMLNGVINLGKNTDVTTAALKSCITSANDITVIDSTGAIKEDTALVTAGDRIANRVIKAENDEYFYYYDISIAQPTNLLTVDFNSYESNEDGLTSPVMPDNTDGNSFNLWGSNAFYQYAEVAKFGKSFDDTVYRLYNVNLNVNADGKSTARHGRILPSTKQYNFEANTAYHISAEIAAGDTNFGYLGISHRYNDSVSPDNNRKYAFCFAKDENDNVVMKSFDTVISDESFIFETDRFYKIDLVYAADASKNVKMDIYVNGKYIATTDFTSDAVKAITGTASKLKYTWLISDYHGYTRTSNVYFDNITMDSYDNGYPAIEYERKSLKNISSDINKLDDGTIYLEKHGITADEFLAEVKDSAEVKLFNRDYSAEITGTKAVCNGAILVEYLNSGKTMYYNEICMPYDSVSIGRDIITNEDETVTYSYYARSYFAHSGKAENYKFILAAYQDGGRFLESVNSIDVNLEEKYSREFARNVILKFDSYDSNRTFKAFIWDGITMAPVTNSQVYPPKYDIDSNTEEILVMSIGNSYSQDSITYLKEIAAADGVKLGAYNCYVGGRQLIEHYNSWKTDTWEYEMRSGNKWIMNTSSKNMVSEYDWDYVILQAATHPAADDKVLWDENYGSVSSADIIKSFADGVAELAPQATRLFVAPWAPGEELAATAYGGRFTDSEDARGHITSALLERQQVAAEIYSSNGSDAYLPTAVAIDYLIRYYGFPEFVLKADSTEYDNSETSRGVYRDNVCHLTDSVGRVLAGLVWYEMITGNSAEDNAYMNSLSAEDMAKIKAAAHYACKNYKTYNPSTVVPLAE